MTYRRAVWGEAVRVVHNRACMPDAGATAAAAVAARRDWQLTHRTPSSMCARALPDGCRWSSAVVLIGAGLRCSARPSAFLGKLQTPGSAMHRSFGPEPFPPRHSSTLGSYSSIPRAFMSRRLAPLPTRRIRTSHPYPLPVHAANERDPVWQRMARRSVAWHGRPGHGHVPGGHVLPAHVVATSPRVGGSVARDCSQQPQRQPPLAQVGWSIRYQRVRLLWWWWW
jgi:hypothetical protein